ncbi:hypothetical protein [Flavivirga algicola]|uniref:DUF349 domain-containing protein n=1 Tax=Flavivirga algicola TaxID=2729136 RepID=A0ABX1S108_9FLAO|nr:hypothetical protein [Flavivirga algicola]NMH89564.1 hypothetical protein [Flavivirga algicola]
MKTENTFKFVSVRPPQKVPEINPKYDLTGIRSVLREKLSKSNNFKEKAKLAKAYQSSNIYFKNSNTWAAYAPNLDRIEKIIESADNLNNANDLKAFKEKLVKEIGVDVKVIDKDFSNLKEQVWDSFYANLLSNESPEDRDIIVRWIKLLRLWEGINSEMIVNEKIELVNSYNKLTPIIPKELFNKDRDDSKEIDSSKETDRSYLSRVKAIQVKRKEIEKLNHAKKEVEDIFTSKLKTHIKDDLKCKDTKHVDKNLASIQTSIDSINQSMIDYQKYVDQEFKNLKSETKSPQETATDKIVFNASNFGTLEASNLKKESLLASPPSKNSEQAPWLLKIDEIKLKNTKKVLSKSKIDLELTTSPEIVSKLENELAKRNAELEKLMTIERIIPRGKTFVKVKRKLSEDDINETIKSL